MLAGQVVRIGEVLNASPADAKFLIGIGKAIKAADAVAQVIETIQPTSPKRRTSK
jgi:hypothetical protein